MKQFTSTRIWLTQKSTTAILELNGELMGYVIEPPVRIFNIPDDTAIPAGTYNIGIRFSPERNRNVPYLQGVPGFAEGDIEIHWGNFEDSVNPNTGKVQRDSKGCQVVGAGPRETDYIGQSLTLFTKIFTIIDTAIEAGELCQYTIIDILRPAA